MKNITVFIIFIISISSYSQDNIDTRDENRNKGYFNITRFSYIKIHSANQYTDTRGIGRSTDLETDRAYVGSLQTINGYFISSHFSLGIE